MPYVCVTFGDIVIIAIILTRSARIINRLICAIRPRMIGNEREGNDGPKDVDRR